MFQRWKSSHGFRWHGDDSFIDYPPPPPPQLGGQIDLSAQNLGNVSFSCNTWIEPGALHGKPNTTAAVARYGFHTILSTSKLKMITAPSMRLAFPLGDGIILRTNSSSNNLKDYVSGSLSVNMNPDKNVSAVVLVANTRCSGFQLLKASSVCLTGFGNTTELMIHVCST